MNHFNTWNDYERTAKDHLRGLFRTHGLRIVEHINYEGTGHQAEVTRLSERILLYICKECKPERREAAIREYCNTNDVCGIFLK